MAERVFTNCTNSEPGLIYAKNSKIVRVCPLVVDEKDSKLRVIEAGGKKHSPPKKVTLSPYIHAERRRVYSGERLRYPPKRVDSDSVGVPSSIGPGGRNSESCGKSHYERISWGEVVRRDVLS